MSRRPPLVLLSGLLCDDTLWQHQIETLSDIAEIRIADLTGEERLGTMAQRVLAEAPERFALAGHSMGGYVALEIMRQTPDRVQRLALIGTSARPDAHKETEHRKALIDLARQGEFRGVTRRLLPELIHPDRLNDAELAETIFAMAERVGREAFVRQQRTIITRPDSRRDLGLIHCSTLVLCGREDAVTPLAASREMAEKIPRASLVMVEDCGHLAPLERPRVVSAVLRIGCRSRDREINKNVREHPALPGYPSADCRRRVRCANGRGHWRRGDRRRHQHLVRLRPSR